MDKCRIIQFPNGERQRVRGENSPSADAVAALQAIFDAVMEGYAEADGKGHTIHRSSSFRCAAWR